MDFFCFKGLLSGKNQWGDQDSFLVPLKNDSHMFDLKFWLTRHFTYHYSWAYPKMVKTRPQFILAVRSTHSPEQRPEARREEEGRETEKLESRVSAKPI